MKLGIGTVQFGFDYGISNHEGRTSPEEVARILKVAAEHGIRIIDTAAFYGASEETLGQVLPPEYSFSIVTKTPGFSKESITVDDAQLLEDTFHQSLSRLGQSSIYALLAHHADDLLSSNGHLLVEKMQAIKQRGLAKKIGISVYTAQQIDQVLDKFPVDIVQLPINVLDQRLLLSGHLSKLKRLNIEVHARSVFLQGLLLMDPDTLPIYFDSVKDHLKDYHDFILKKGLSPVQASLGFVIGLNEVDTVICGVNNHQQLEEICSSIGPLPTEDFARFAIADKAVLNPSEWRV